MVGILTTEKYKSWKNPFISVVLKYINNIVFT